MSKKEKNDSIVKYTDLIVLGGGSAAIFYGLLRLYDKTVDNIGELYFPELGIWSSNMAWIILIGILLVVIVLYAIYRRSIR